MPPVEKSERERALEIFANIGKACDKLRPGTGGGIELLLTQAYDKGFEDGRSAGEAGWISVEESQPSNDRTVDLYVPRWANSATSEAVCTGRYIASLEEFRPHGSHGFEKDVTHWRNRPNPPVAGPIADKGDAHADSSNES